MRGAMRSGSRKSELPGDSPLDSGPVLLHELVPPGPELLTITVRVLRAERGSMLFGHAKLTHAVVVSDIAKEVLLPSPYGKSRTVGIPPGDPSIGRPGPVAGAPGRRDGPVRPEEPGPNSRPRGGRSRSDPFRTGRHGERGCGRVDSPWPSAFLAPGREKRGMARNGSGPARVPAGPG